MSKSWGATETERRLEVVKGLKHSGQQELPTGTDTGTMPMLAVEPGPIYTPHRPVLRVIRGGLAAVAGIIFLRSKLVRYALTAASLATATTVTPATIDTIKGMIHPGGHMSSAVHHQHHPLTKPAIVLPPPRRQKRKKHHVAEHHVAPVVRVRHTATPVPSPTAAPTITPSPSPSPSATPSASVTDTATPSPSSTDPAGQLEAPSRWE